MDAELSGQVNAQIERDLLPKLVNQFPNVDYQIKGQAERAEDSGIRLSIAFLISIVLIMMTISLNFKSFYQSRLILMVVPVGIFQCLTWSWHCRKALLHIKRLGCSSLGRYISK